MLDATPTTVSIIGATRLKRAPLWFKVLALGLVVTCLAIVARWGLLNHPEALPPEGEAAERRMTSVFGYPEERDDQLIGDLLIERFYAIDAVSRERYVWDICKGRVAQLQRTMRRDLTGAYTLLLDRTGLAQERRRLAAFVAASAPPPQDAGRYLGLAVPGGGFEGFVMNYDGNLPRRFSEFRAPGGATLDPYLESLSFDAVSGGAYLVNSTGTNYLVSNSFLFPEVRNIFRVEKVVFVSHLLVVDLTSDSQQAAYEALRTP